MAEVAAMLARGEYPGDACSGFITMDFEASTQC